jgi:DNA-binding MltR family transcriptional regulator
MTKKELSQNLEAWQDAWLKITEEFTPNASDRTIVIVSAASLDTHLRQLISSFLINDKKQVKRLLDPERPLGSFGARIGAAYCLGLISEDEYHDLRIIQQVRNNFAHELSISFADNEIRNLCNTLELAKVSPSLPSVRPPGPRTSFVDSVIELVAHMRVRIVKAEQNRRVVPRSIALS